MEVVTPLISIIVPVYNTEKYLHRCIDSIIAQTFTDWECILIDDGSTDGSPDICDEYAKNDNRIKVFHQENGGPSKARNTGLQVEIGVYIYFMDSDDCLVTNALDVITSNLSRYKPDILKFGYIRKNNIGENIISCKKDEFITEPWMMLDRTEGTEYCGFVWNTVFHRNCISNIRFREELNWCEDHLFSFECFRQAKSMLLIPNVLYIYNIHDNGLSNVRDPYAVYYVAQTELPIKLSMVDESNKDVKEMILAEYYGKLNFAVKILFWGKTNYRDFNEYRGKTIEITKGFTFPKTYNYAHIFYRWPSIFAYIALCIKNRFNKR